MYPHITGFFMYPHITLTGMLVVQDVVPQGPAHNKLRPGDIVHLRHYADMISYLQLLELNFKAVSTFNDVEDVLDNHVGAYIHVTLLRGGEVQTCSVKVGMWVCVLYDESWFGCDVKEETSKHICVVILGRESCVTQHMCVCVNLYVSQWPRRTKHAFTYNHIYAIG
jgi:hypothetical protein